MKIWKFFLVCMAFTTLGLTACGGDDDNGGGNNAIVGTWSCVTEPSWTISFNSNGTYSESYPAENYYDHGTYTFTGKYITLTDSEGETWDAIYKKEEGNKEFIDYCGDTFQRR